MGLLYMLALWSNVYMLYRPWIQWLCVAGATLMGGHYRTDIISGVDHLRLDSVVPLVSCKVAHESCVQVQGQIHRELCLEKPIFYLHKLYLNLVPKFEKFVVQNANKLKMKLTN